MDLHAYDACLRRNSNASLAEFYNPEFAATRPVADNLWQYSAELQLHPYFQHVPGYVPLFPVVSRMARYCPDHANHASRMQRAARSISGRCLVISNHFNVFENFGTLLHKDRRGLYPLRKCVLAGFIDCHKGKHCAYIRSAVSEYVPLPYVENYFSEAEMMKGRPRRTLVWFRGAFRPDDVRRRFQLRYRVLRIDAGLLPVKEFNCSDGVNIQRVERRDAVRNSRQTMAVEMATSVFCLVIPGDTRSTSRLYDALAAGCVPLVIGSYSNAVPNPTGAFDDLPFHDRVRYGRMVLRIDETRWMTNTTLAIAEVIAPLLEPRARSTIASMQGHIRAHAGEVLYRSRSSKLRSFLYEAYLKRPPPHLNQIESTERPLEPPWPIWRG